MCVKWKGDWVRTKGQIVAYKIVRKWGDIGYISPIISMYGTTRLQDTCRKPKPIVYTVGSRIIAKTPGIYLYQRKGDALGKHVLEVVIPAGALVRRGRQISCPTINATEIIVKRVL